MVYVMFLLEITRYSDTEVYSFFIFAQLCRRYEVQSWDSVFNNVLISFGSDGMDTVTEIICYQCVGKAFLSFFI